MPAISFQSVSKQYDTPRGSLKALDEVSFDIAPGEFFGLLGPNGAGKTTLISILAGLARATGGQVLVDGVDVQADFAAARRKLGICGEHGGDPASIAFCEKVGLDYVSASPYRVPIARLAAAQAALRAKG